MIMNKYTRYLKHLAILKEGEHDPYPVVLPPKLEIYKYQLAIRLKKLEVYIGWWQKATPGGGHIFGIRWVKIRR